jgi:hypothetical protein
MRTSELSGAALDWAVAKLEGVLFPRSIPPYSTDWAQGGPIIEREGITVAYCAGDLGEPRSGWVATPEQQGWDWGYGPYHEQDDEKSFQVYKNTTSTGPTPLLAAMRCYVASKLGDDVDIPEELQ